MYVYDSLRCVLSCKIAQGRRLANIFESDPVYYLLCFFSRTAVLYSAGRRTHVHVRQLLADRSADVIGVTTWPYWPADGVLRSLIT